MRAGTVRPSLARGSPPVPGASRSRSRPHRRRPGGHRPSCRRASASTSAAPRARYGEHDRAVARSAPPVRLQRGARPACPSRSCGCTASPATITGSPTRNVATTRSARGRASSPRRRNSCVAVDPRPAVRSNRRSLLATPEARHRSPSLNVAVDVDRGGRRGPTRSAVVSYMSPAPRLRARPAAARRLHRTGVARAATGDRASARSVDERGGTAPRTDCRPARRQRSSERHCGRRATWRPRRSQRK